MGQLRKHPVLPLSDLEAPNKWYVMAAESDSGRRRNCSESADAETARGSRRTGER